MPLSISVIPGQRPGYPVRRFLDYRVKARPARQGVLCTPERGNDRVKNWYAEGASLDPPSQVRVAHPVGQKNQVRGYGLQLMLKP